jgi:ribosomal protein L11 methyltransferase
MMHLWRKLADSCWVNAHQDTLRIRSRGRLVIVSTPGCKRLQLEIACTTAGESRKLIRQFGGRSEKWPNDWLRRFADRRKSKPINIGKRLLISNTGETLTRHSKQGDRSHLLIPASAAFGTGEHTTTAMSLRLLERLTRNWEKGWSLADLGTGSGILVLAAKCFGAARVAGIDIDPKAISIAKANARLNKIRNTDFQLADVRSWKPKRSWNIITANLYSELLIEILPKMNWTNSLILSGVLRTEENKFLRALRRNEIEILKANRRGKWIAVLARGSAV